MFSRFHRLNFRLYNDRNIFRLGKLKKEKFFELVYDFKGKKFQFGIIIPKKIITKAATRNALRRTITASISREFVEINNLRLAVRIISPEANLISRADWQKFFDDLLKEISTEQLVKK